MPLVRKSSRSLFSIARKHLRSRAHCPTLRPFTQSTRQLLLSTPQSRPQLPFLYSRINPTPRHQAQTHISRLLSTETKAFIKDTAKGVARLTAYFWAIGGLLLVAKFGIDNEILERAYPSPPVWSWVSRWKLRTAKGQEHPDESSYGYVDWANTGNLYRQILVRLENPAIDGAGVHPQLGEDEDIYVDGIGKTGLNISSQPEPWRRGYHDTLMGAARAAEQLDSCVRDKTRNIAFPADVVIGPSNPRPRPVPFGARSAPKEEDCEPAFEKPQVYYMKILTTHGFTSRQRLDAALAYADWLRFKGLNSSAEEMHSWAMDIAIAGLPNGSEAVDKKTGILTPGQQVVSSNLLLASNSLAMHHAQTGNLSAALPIFLSVLRAQQSLPLPLISDEKSAVPPSESMFPMLESIKSFFSTPDFPPPPPTGDEPATRSPTSLCAEAGTMVHIGEILYASSKPIRPPGAEATSLHLSGLSWTRDGVGLAEQTLRSLGAQPASHELTASNRQRLSSKDASTQEEEKEGKARCAECLNTGMENWSSMVKKLEFAEALARKVGTKQSKEIGENTSRERSSGWFWGGTTAKNTASDGTRITKKWVEEVKRVEARRKDIRTLLREEGLAR